MATNQFYIGTDIGGTFTDVVISDSTGERTLNAKVLTTPADPVQGVMNGVREALASAGAKAEEVRRLVHATTLPTNLVIERKGGRVVYVTTLGFGDMFLIGKEQRSPDVIFDLNYRRPEPLIPRNMVVEVDERLDPTGAVLSVLSDAELDRAVGAVAALAPEGV